MHLMTERGEPLGDRPDVHRSAMRGRHRLVDGRIQNPHLRLHQLSERILTRSADPASARTCAGLACLVRPFYQQREERAGADAAEQPDVEHHDRRHRLKRAEHDPAAGDRALGLEARGAKR